ncbi:LemA family protein [Pelomonas aquatica]|jgi:LemA protein|uniref:LemA family protein n=1 Tax=Pelomonas aquatica TaxID=431058 RepID=A0A9X4LIX9_9BURK|nr:LemA family protein [Pelomonas aquatica]MCY4755418.1 LemA family protein [Pelomonas aquatica]MDG0861715.1 LemA family protein [Pelomonas aquatica]
MTAWLNWLNWQTAGVIAAALLFFWGVGAYNRLMSLRNAIGEAFAQLDAHLKARGEACDKLLAAVAPRLPSEQATFDALASAQAESQSAAQASRARPWAPDPVGSLAVASALHAAALTRLLSLLDHQAELRSETDIDALVSELKLIERQRAFTRQVFNQAVGQYNEALHQFPTRILANLYGFTEARSL